MKALPNICPNCGTKNRITAKFCENCGTAVNTTINTSNYKESNNTTTKENESWWDQQNTGVKALSIIGICCVGIIIIGVLMAALTPESSSTSTQDTSTSTTTEDIPTDVTIDQLYGSSIAKGTKVKVTGTVLQADGYSLRMKNSDGEDILVEGYNLEAYEDQSVTVVGTFKGPTSYTTIMGSSRTVPTITGAEIV